MYPSLYITIRKISKTIELPIRIVRALTVLLVLLLSFAIVYSAKNRLNTIKKKTSTMRPLMTIVTLQIGN